jgi:PadR family transcriptional regulator PadR
MSDSLPLLKGTLDVLVLKALTWGPMHGFAVAAWIEQGTAGDLTVEDGALYQALHRMEERGLIEGEWGTTENNRRAKFYRMTPRGRQHLMAEAAAWDRYARAVGRLLATA